MLNIKNWATTLVAARNIRRRRNQSCSHIVPCAMAVESLEPKTLLCGNMDPTSCPNESPEFSEEQYEFTVMHGTVQEIGSVSAHDPNYDVVQYSTSDVNFYIDSSGRIIADSEKLGRGIHHFYATAMDGRGGVDQASVLITVKRHTPGNQQPFFSQSSPVFNLTTWNDGRVDGITVTDINGDNLKVSVRHSDTWKVQGQTRSFEIYQSDPADQDSTDGIRFYLDGGGTVPHGEYNVTVRARDGKSEPVDLDLKVVVAAKDGTPPTFDVGDHMILFNADWGDTINEKLATLPFSEPDGDTVVVRYEIDKSIWATRQAEIPDIMAAIEFKVNGDSEVEVWYQRIGRRDKLKDVIFHVTIEDEDGEDTVAITLKGIDQDEAPVFEPDNYVLTVTSNTTDGEVIGRVFAFDPDGDDDKITYAAFGVFADYVTVGNDGVITATDAAGLRYAVVNDSQDGVNFSGTVVATDEDNRAATAIVTIQIENDAEDIGRQIDLYLNQWQMLATARATAFHAVGTTIIRQDAQQMYEKAVEWADDGTNLLWGFTAFVPNPYKAGIAATATVLTQIAVRAYNEDQIDTADEWKDAALTLASGLLIRTNSEISDKWTDETNAWTTAKQIIDRQTPKGSTERAERYREYLVTLQSRLPIVGATAPSVDDIRKHLFPKPTE